MDTIETIYNRRAVRDYKDQILDKETINVLLDAAIQAPTAMHEEPWAFVVVQDQELLNQISDFSKKMLITEARSNPITQKMHMLEHISREDYNVFYNAKNLIIICSKFQGPYTMADCWLAAENLMLCACAKNLGSCVIGFSINALNSLEWKQKLGIPVSATIVAPIIVGVPAGITPPVARNKPEIISWK